MQEDIYLIDGSAYIYRAYYGVAPLTNSRGMATQAVFGFVNIINRLIREKQPKYLAVAFDSRGPVFRHTMFPAYKANRPPMPADLAVQVPYIKDYVLAANILSLQQDGVEADDIIASVCRTMVAAGHRVIIITGDKDLLQLVSDKVTIWEPMKDLLLDREAVQNKYQVSPEQLLDTFALIGDSSDNVPGVPGIGPKTAEKLINQYGSLDNLYARITELKTSKMQEKLVENREMAFLSKELIRLKYDVPVPLSLADYAALPANTDKLVNLYTELEFSSFLKGIDTSQPVSTKGFSLVQTGTQLAELVKILLEAEIIAVDTETTSLEARTASLVGISLAVDLDRAWYIPLGHKDTDGMLIEQQLPADQVKNALLPILADGKRAKLGHNLKYDYTVLMQQWGLALGGQLLDTLIAAHLLEIPGRSLKLDDLCQKIGIRLTSFSEVTAGDKRSDSFAYVPIAAAGDYSCEDVYATLRLWREYAPLLAEKDLEKLFLTVEMPLVPILAAMEMRGICLDTKQLQILSADFREKLNLLEQEIYALAGQQFNILSPRQLGQILFEELKLPHGRKTKTGYSTDVAVLEKLAFHHALPARILEYRTVSKLLNTYVDNLAAMQDPVSHRVHTSFNQAVTATGRLSSSNPNLQNIPIRSEDGNRIRRAFVPGDGLVFLSADYSQIDLRVLAHYSQDSALLEAFNKGDDIHTRTAVEIFGVSPLFVTAEMRRVAKSINFGIVYGMSSFGLSQQLNISRKEAQTFIDRYFRHYAGVKRFMTEIVHQAGQNGWVSTLLQRRRSLPEIHAKNKAVREFAERTAINTPIQGTAADIIKLAMLAVAKAFDEASIPAVLLLQIHDELVFELPPDSVEAATPVIRQAMEKALILDVPLVVNIEVTNSLAKKN